MRIYILFAFTVLVLVAAIVALVITGHYFWAAVMALALLGARVRISDDESQPGREEKSMDWTNEKRLELIAALALHHVRHAPLGESWHGLMQRILYLATWPDNMLEFNKKNFADAVRMLENATEETD